MTRDEISGKVCGLLSGCKKDCSKCLPSRKVHGVAIADWIQEKFVEKEKVREVIRDVSDKYPGGIFPEPAPAKHGDLEPSRNFAQGARYKAGVVTRKLRALLEGNQPSRG